MCLCAGKMLRSMKFLDFSDLNHLPWYRELTVKCVKVWFLKEPVINAAFRTGEAVFILSVTPVSPSIQGEKRPKTLSSSHNHTTLVLAHHFCNSC